MDKIFIKKLEDLYKKKQFTKIKFEISSLSDEQKDNSFILNLLGIIELFEKNIKEARNYFEKSLTKNPYDIHSLLNLSKVSFFDRDHKKIINFLKKFNEKNPNNREIIENLANLNFSAGNVEAAIFYHEKLIENEKYDIKDLTALIFLLNYSNNYSHEKYKKFCKLYDKNISKHSNLINLNKKDHSKLKIGFLSYDLRNHPIGFFLKDFIYELKKKGMHSIAFNLFENKNNIFANELKKNFSEWYDVGNLNDQELTKLIYEKKIYYLFDLSGFNTNNRLSIFKNKPAPVQISWLGYCNSTQLKEIDYLIADPYVISDKDQINYSEKILKIPNIWNALGFQEDVLINELPALSNKYFTFGSFNNFLKISDDNLKVWKKILHGVPNSRLMLKSLQKVDIEYKKYLTKKLEVKEERLVVLSLSDKIKNHLEDYNKVDLSLDTFPYNGVTTSFESIWMGVPFLTIKGDRFISRCGFSINKNIGLDNFICKDKEDYILKAISFTSEDNLNYLSSLRESLRKKAIASPLFDTRSFTEDFCKLLSSL